MGIDRHRISTTLVTRLKRKKKVECKSKNDGGKRIEVHFPKIENKTKEKNPTKNISQEIRNYSLRARLDEWRSIPRYSLMIYWIFRNKEKIH